MDHPTQPQPPPQEPQNQSPNFLKFICIGYLIYSLFPFLGFFSININKIEDINTIDPRIYTNSLLPNQEFSLHVYLQNSTSTLTLMNRNFIYKQSDNNALTINISIPYTKEMYKLNDTYSIESEIQFENKVAMAKIEKANWKGSYEKNATVHKSIPLLLFQIPKPKEAVGNLLSDELPVTHHEEVDPNKPVKPFYPESIAAYLVYDTKGFLHEEMISLPHLVKYTLNDMFYNYDPMLWLNNFWNLKRDYIELNENSTMINFTLCFQMYSSFKFKMISFLDQSKIIGEQYGLPDSIEEIKEMILNTSTWFFLLTMLISSLHTVLELLAHKNEISFWRNSKSMQGISVNTLFVQLIMNVIVFLYILDSKETSKIIIFSIFVEVGLMCWKITKASKISRKPTFPYVSISDHETYKDSPTKMYDKVAIKYMSILLGPLLLVYVIYSVIYQEHKGWYSFIVSSLASGVYMFGFITMTPQLYINYKLKSVENMPWRSMAYKFTNTIIDDLFAFIIKMPLLHRLSCFRDDIIFVIYIVQRCMYTVDKRRNEFGTFDEKKEKTE